MSPLLLRHLMSLCPYVTLIALNRWKRSQKEPIEIDESSSHINRIFTRKTLIESAFINRNKVVYRRFAEFHQHTVANAGEATRRENMPMRTYCLAFTDEGRCGVLQRARSHRSL